MTTVIAISLLISRSQAPCTARGELPDPTCTPGMASVHDAHRVCSQPTRERRKVSAATKRRVFAAYGLRWPGERGAFEVDHLIPLSLGGSNDSWNLWPEPVASFPSKDRAEAFLRREVCAGRMELGEAQRMMAEDWRRALGFQ